MEGSPELNPLGAGQSPTSPMGTRGGDPGQVSTEPPPAASRRAATCSPRLDFSGPPPSSPVHAQAHTAKPAFRSWNALQPHTADWQLIIQKTTLHHSLSPTIHRLASLLIILGTGYIKLFAFENVKCNLTRVS